MSNQALAYELNLGEYWQIIQRRRWVIIACTLGMALLTAVFSWFSQPQPLYQSKASIKIDADRNMTGLLLKSLTFTSVDDVRTQIALINSFVMMERVAKYLDLVPKDMTRRALRDNPSYMATILRLKRVLQARQEGRSGIITITATSSTPEEAQALAQALVVVFQDYHLKENNKRIYEAKHFIQKQLKSVSERLRRSEDAVRDYRRSHNITPMGGSSEIMAKLMADLQLDYRHEVKRLGDLNFALGQLKERIQAGPWDFQAVSVSGAVSDYFKSLNKRLMDMALTYTKLSTNYTDEHPQIQELRDQARDILRSMLLELDKQVHLTNQRLDDLKRNIDDAELRFIGDPQQALELQRLARGVRLDEDLYKVLEKKYQEILIKESESVKKVNVIRPAFASRHRINPSSTSKTVIAGMLLGLVLGLVLALILESVDTSMDNSDDIERLLDAPVMVEIPYVSDEQVVQAFKATGWLATKGEAMQQQKRLIAHFLPESEAAESFRSLRTRLMFSCDTQLKCLLMNSASETESSAFVAANLAVVLAQQGLRVLLVDANMRAPAMADLFGVQSEPGLSDCLMGRCLWKHSIRHFSDVMLGDMGVDEALLTPGLDQLDLLPAGQYVSNPLEILSSIVLDQLIHDVSQEYDFIIFDSPPMGHFTDAALLASKLDGVALVYHLGAVARAVLRRVKQDIEQAGAKVLGVVVSDLQGSSFGSGERGLSKQGQLQRLMAWFKNKQGGSV